MQHLEYFVFAILPHGICFPLEIFRRAFSNVFKDINDVKIYTLDAEILRWSEEIKTCISAVLGNYNIKFYSKKDKLNSLKAICWDYNFSEIVLD